MNTKFTRAVPLLAGVIFLLLPAVLLAGHKSYVGNTIIDATDPGIYEAHGENCAYRHYHGELNGVADPNPEGCGHGEVKVIVHGEGDGETIPPPPAKGNWERFTTWLSDWWNKSGKETTKNVIDVAAESNGIPPPNQVSELVDITKEMTPQIMEKAEGVKEYRESVPEGEDTLGIYTDLDKVPENPTLSQRFFKWFNSLTD